MRFPANVAWITRHIGERYRRTMLADHISHNLDFAWAELPDTIRSYLDAYQQRVQGAKFELKSGSDKVIVRQLAPVQGGATVTRNKQHTSIVAVFDDGNRMEISVAPKSITSKTVESLATQILYPVLFPELYAQDRMASW